MYLSCLLCHIRQKYIYTCEKKKKKNGKTYPKNGRTKTQKNKQFIVVFGATAYQTLHYTRYPAKLNGKFDENRRTLEVAQLALSPAPELKDTPASA